MIKNFFLKPDKTPASPLLDLFALVNLFPQTLEECNFLAQKMFLRDPAIERWDMVDSSEQKAKKQEYFLCLQKLGLIEEIKPQDKDYKSVVLLGTGVRDFINRSRFLQTLNLNYSQITVLTAERPLSQIELDLLQQEYDITHLDTEKSMINFFMQKHFAKWKILSLPMHKNVRPTTQDTIIYWMQSSPESGSYLLISNQPYGYYQYYAAKAIVQKYTDQVHLDVAAQKMYKTDNLVSVCLDSVARILYLLTS